MPEHDLVTTLTESGWFTPSVVVPAVSVLIASAVVPLLLHWLRGRREQNARVFEMRREVYTRYFQKYEEAAEGVGNDYEQFSKVTLKSEFRKLLEAENSPEAIVAFQEAVGEFPHRIQNAHRKATEEVTTIKLLGSQKLFELTKEFERLHQEILEMSSAWLSEMHNAMTMPNFDGPIASEMKRKGEKTRELKEEIIRQMRVELGLAE